MDWIEQAVFTSAETDRGTGYHVAAASPGVCEADVRELAAWGPSHDALIMPGVNAQSLNFHPLPSGCYCVSRTTPAGWEYSGRGGARVYTQSLIVTPKTLIQFANSPFALFRAALAAGVIRQYDELPPQLEAFRLPGRAAAVDAVLLSRLTTNPGAEWLATLLQAILDSVTIAIAGGPPSEHVIAGLLNCLPPECRTEFSFSTGLRFSSRRPFRIVSLSGDGEEQRRVERLYNLAVLRLSETPPAEYAPLDGWPRFVHRVLKAGRSSFLASQLARRRLNFSLQDLPALGLQLLEELDAASLDGAPAAQGEENEGENAVFADEAEASAAEETPPAADEFEPGPDFGMSPSRREHRQSHAAHPEFASKSGATVPTRPRTPAPSRQLDLDDPAMLDKFGQLDDLVFEAIAGRTEALEQLKELWPQLRSRLDRALFDESREQYLRYALTVWTENAERDGVRDPAKAIQSLDVLSLLFNDE